MATMTKTTIGLNLKRDGDSGAQNPKLLYIALGTGTTAPSAGDTKLANEVFRKLIATYTNGSTGVITATLYVDPTECNGFTIAEVGVFAGNATSTLNSGVLLYRALYSPTHTKNSGESMSIPVAITYS